LLLLLSQETDSTLTKSYSILSGTLHLLMGRMVRFLVHVSPCMPDANWSEDQYSHLAASMQEEAAHVVSAVLVSAVAQPIKPQCYGV
jgi:hypothetical protein